MVERFLLDIGELRYFEVTEGTVLSIRSFLSNVLPRWNGIACPKREVAWRAAKRVSPFHVPLLIFVAYKKSVSIIPEGTTIKAKPFSYRRYT